MITEFGAANGTQCAGYVTDMVNYMAQNPEYIGWTAWAAGPFWGPYSPCCADGKQWGSLEPGSLASDGSPGLYSTVWLAEIQPLLPTTLVKTGISSLNPVGGGSSSSSSTVKSTSTSTKQTTSSTTLKTSTTTSSKITTTTSAAAGVPMWGQCGGMGYTGSTVCAQGTCKYSNPWYSQCL
jgi:endoglucanase